jgi:S-adenosylhomocysteine hydrolase
LTYGGVNLEKLSDLQQLKAKSILEHCGQFPNQIFFKKHPKRNNKIINVKNNFKNMSLNNSKLILSKQPIILIKNTNDKIIVITENGFIHFLKVDLNSEVISK